MKSGIVLSVARSGTHMICKLLNMFGLKEFQTYNGRRHIFTNLPPENNYAFGDHVDPVKPFLEEANQRKIVFITRDPRDIVVSTCFAMLANSKYQIPLFKNKNINAVITYLIEGYPAFEGASSHPDINTFFRSKIKWRDQPSAYYTTFEKIVGSRESREQEIKNISKHLEIELTDEVLKDCVDNLVGSNEIYPGQFRKGIIGDWKNNFTDDHKKLFKKVAGQLLIQEGYEKDLEW